MRQYWSADCGVRIETPERIRVPKFGTASDKLDCFKQSSSCCGLMHHKRLTMRPPRNLLARLCCRGAEPAFDLVGVLFVESVDALAERMVHDYANPFLG